MSHWYTNRDAVKDALGLPASSTADHDQIDAAITNVSRLLDEWIGVSVGPYQATRYYEAKSARCLYLDEPLTAVTALAVDTNADGVTDSTWTSSDYWLGPANARAGDLARPYWEIETRPNSTAVFPVGAARGVAVTGTWGWSNETKNTTATVATGANATATTLALNGATAVHPGQTLAIGSEMVFVREVDGTASSVAVDRAQNGTSAASISSGAAISAYVYPMVEQAALWQAQQDFRAKDMPEGFAGGEPFGMQRMQVGGGGLHPFVKRQLAGLRTPVVA